MAPPLSPSDGQRYYEIGIWRQYTAADNTWTVVEPKFDDYPASDGTEGVFFILEGHPTDASGPRWLNASGDWVGI